MRFITEGDLRDLYKKENFSSYAILPGTKITPGAREFLVDRKISILGHPAKEKTNVADTAEQKADRNLETIECKLKSIEALSLHFAEELLDCDIDAARKLIELGKPISVAERLINGENPENDFHAGACTGIDENSGFKDLEDCFKINAFHIQLKKGKGIIRFHRLRCALRELKADIRSLYEKREKDWIFENLNKTINEMINTLSQHICDAVGGEECQIKK